jgi:hypothetical protein
LTRISRFCAAHLSVRDQLGARAWPSVRPQPAEITPMKTHSSRGPFRTLR